MANDPKARESGTRVARKRPAKAPAKKVAPPVAAVDPFAAPARQEVEAPVSEETTPEEPKVRKKRTPDPLLAAKKRLEAARKRQEKAQKKADAVTDVTTELEAANAELEAAQDEFTAAVDAV